MTHIVMALWANFVGCFFGEHADRAVNRTRLKPTHSGGFPNVFRCPKAAVFKLCGRNPLPVYLLGDSRADFTIANTFRTRKSGLWFVSFTASTANDVASIFPPMANRRRALYLGVGRNRFVLVSLVD
jgi:hypothetical protein